MVTLPGREKTHIGNNRIETIETFDKTCLACFIVSPIEVHTIEVACLICYNLVMILLITIWSSHIIDHKHSTKLVPRWIHKEDHS